MKSFLSLRLALSLAFSSLLLQGCSTFTKPVVDYNHQYDFSQVRTIAFYEGSGQVSGSSPNHLGDIQIRRINNVLITTLDEKGLKFSNDPARADLLMSWHLETEEKESVSHVTEPVGGYYGGYSAYNTYSGYECWSCRGYVDQVDVYEYTKGTFIVDMIDPRTRKSVWRSSVTTTLKDQPETDPAKYKAESDIILAKFPPYLIAQ